MNAFYERIGHRRHYSPGELGQLLERPGFSIEQLYAAGFPFFNFFRMFITWRGDNLIKDVTGPPSRTVRFGMWVFDLLLHFNLMCWGWQSDRRRALPRGWHSTGGDGCRGSGELAPAGRAVMPLHHDRGDHNSVSDAP